jgi:predicted DNA-binding transcriptional regulator YafY
MRRADRLFQLVQLIRGRRLSTAAFLAERLAVTSRTIYRDVADLQHQGVPIEGEAGVGLRLGAGFDLPPLMFTEGEAKALVVAIRLAQIGMDAHQSVDAEAALSKILSVLPSAARAAAISQAVYAPQNAVTGLDSATRQRLQALREAVHAKRKLQISYLGTLCITPCGLRSSGLGRSAALFFSPIALLLASKRRLAAHPDPLAADPPGLCRASLDLQQQTSQRTLRPLGCFYWGKVWTLTAWCEERADFRNFRMDRIQSCVLLDSSFKPEPGKTLADFLRKVGAPPMPP